MVCPECRNNYISEYNDFFSCDNSECNFRIFKKNKFLNFDLDEYKLSNLLIYKELNISGDIYVLSKNDKSFFIRKKPKKYTKNELFPNIRIYEKTYFDEKNKTFLPRYFGNSEIRIENISILLKGESILHAISTKRKKTIILKLIFKNNEIKIIN